jgi:integrase
LTGHVRKEGKTWYYAIELGRDENNNRKIKKKRGFKTKKDAQKALTEVLNELMKGTYIEPSKLLYRDYMKDWIQGKVTKGVKNRTIETYTWLLDKHILPHLGQFELQQITSLHVEKMLSTLKNEGKIADENIQKVYTLVNDSLNKALKFSLVSKNVASVVSRPKAKKKDIEVWDVDEANKFISVAEKDRSYIVFLLALTTGMRQSEILGLRWKDVDLKNGTVYVSHQLERRNKGFTDVKTKAGRRNIEIDPDTVEALKRQKKLIAGERLISGTVYENYDLVVPTSVGTPYLDSNIRKIFKRLIKEANVKKIRFHDLRHSHVSILLKMGENIKVVAERLGHADSRITQDTYGHLYPNMQKDTAKRFGQTLFGAKEQKSIHA